MNTTPPTRPAAGPPPSSRRRWALSLTLALLCALPAGATATPLWQPTPPGDGPLARAAHLADRGELQRARESLAGVSPETTPERVRLAALWARVGEPDRAVELLVAVRGETALERALLDVIRGGELEVGAATCDYTTVVDALLAMRLPARAGELAAAVREADPGCAAAWAVTLEASATAGSSPSPELARDAVARFPADPRVLRAAAIAFVAAGWLDDADDALARMPAGATSPWGGPGALLGPLMADVEAHAGRTDRWATRWLADPSDLLATYLYGAGLYERGEFPRSLAMLASVEARAPGDQRTQLLLALNERRLDLHTLADARIARAAAAPVADVDVLIASAELLAHGDPARALVELRRATALCRAWPPRALEPPRDPLKRMSRLRTCMDSRGTECGTPLEPDDEEQLQAGALDGVTGWLSQAGWLALILAALAGLKWLAERWARGAR